MRLTVALTVWMVVCVRTAVSVVYYVDIDNPTPSEPYTLWETAANDIQSAVNQAGNDDTVLVAEGHYYLTSEIVVSKHITIQSVNGPAETVVDGNGAVRCFNLDSTYCVVNSFTIINGYIVSGEYPKNSGGGIYCTDDDPEVRDCIIVGNYAFSGGGMLGGVANNCTFSNNVADYTGGGMEGGTANNCLFVANRAVFLFGGGMNNGTANNCTMVQNSAMQNNQYLKGKGGGMYGGVANNCIVWSNSATSGGADLDDTATTNTCSPDVKYGVVGNIKSAPLFVDGPNGNYRLAANSPCINAGSNTFVSVATDLYGHPRILDDIVDMGAYEFGFFGDCFITNFIPSSRETILQWTTFPTWDSTVSWSANLVTMPFTNLSAALPYPVNTYTDTVHGSDSKCFYRVDLQP